MNKLSEKAQQSLEAIEELNRQINRFGMVIGKYDINATVKDAMTVINELKGETIDERSTRYSNAHNTK